MHLTAQSQNPTGDPVPDAAAEGAGASGDSIEGYKGRGVYVPAGMTVAEIMEGAWALERQFDIAPYISRAMARAVFGASLALRSGDGRSQQ